MTDLSQQLYDKYFDKLARLSNGALVPLKTAAALWDSVQTMTMSADEKRELLELRERALDGSPFTDPTRREELTNLGLLDADGRVGPAARNVVLSALTGDLENTHVVSPFTQWSDRKLAEFVTAVTAVKEDYRPELATRLLREVIGPDWVRRIQDHSPGRGGFSVN